MIEVLSAPEHVAAFRLAGTLSGDDYDELDRALEAKLRAQEHIGVYVDATDFKRITLPAFRKRLRHGAKNWKRRSQFQRAAVVTNKRWMSSLTRLGGMIIPELQARSFAAHDSDAALRWVALNGE